MMTENQAMYDCLESQLVFELWELIVPTKVKRSDLMHETEVKNSQEGDNEHDDWEEKLEERYMTQVKV